MHAYLTFPQQCPCSSTASAGFSGGGFSFHDPKDIFSAFFGTSNPFAAFGMGGDDEDGGGGAGMPGGFRMFMGGMPGMGGMGGMAGAGMPGMGGMGGMPGMAGMGGAGGRRRGGPVKGEPVKRQLLCSLEELYTGTTKRVKVTRQRLNPDGRTTHPEEKILEIAIKPGWKKGTTVTFENEGDEAPGVVPGDLQFIIGEKEHDRFVREGNNLVHTARVSLAQALTGFTLTLQTLDGRTLNIPCNEIISPGYFKTVRGEGMPISKSPGSKGDLTLKFSIAFPSYLSEEKKRELRALLS